MKKMKNLTTASLILLLMACGPSTEIVSTFKAPGLTKLNYKKVFISALSSDASVKQTVESSIADGLSKRGVASVRSVDAFPPGLHTKNKDSVMQIIRSTGADGIITLALIRQEKETNYQPPSYYGTFGGYYGYGYGSFYSPGYYSEDKIYFIQTMVYDVATEKLDWSAQSKTTNPSSLNDFLTSYKEALSGQLVKDGLVQPVKK